MTNRMSSVANLLGMELGEVFRIKDYPNFPETYFRFADDGLMQSVNRTSWHSAPAWMWKGLITGALKITKLPWKPSYNDIYYMPTVVSRGKYLKLFWTGSEADKSSYQQGLVYRTKEEAIELAEEMLSIAKDRRRLL